MSGTGNPDNGKFPTAATDSSEESRYWYERDKPSEDLPADTRTGTGSIAKMAECYEDDSVNGTRSGTSDTDKTERYITVHINF
ncbi:hypothetical protein FCM35_KLT17318 [Carex littledalei]|uniref:Uncharacterized protein n=1 Tax=Carex littledalei TaxID=544730 RepID=A0A833RMA9_9POAL|nr:hypothetical protein FCM35_KLT17318 [Carex littledalei]